MKNLAMCVSRVCVVLLGTGILLPSVSQATPYATALTNDAGTISFRLNESADNVKIISSGGATTNDLGALPAGLQTFSLGIVGPFKVAVRKASAAGFLTPVAANRGAVLQISTDTNIVRFSQPRGVAVNTDPASPNFGRVYVANGASGTISNLVSAGTRTLGDGIYMLNADMTDAVGQGDTARTAGLDFSSGGTASPYRLTIGQDGNLYISDWSDPGGTLLTCNPDVSGGGANVLSGVGGPFPVTTNRYHGSIAAAVVEGSLAGGNLVAYVIDEDLQPDRTTSTATARNSLWRHDIGGVVPGPEVIPTRIGTTPWIKSSAQTMDFTRGTNGYFYVSDYRSTGSNEGSIFILDPTGATAWDSRAATRTMTGNSTSLDVLRASGGITLSPNTPHMAVVNLESNGVTVVPLVGALPDLTNRLVFGFGTNLAQGRGISFDAAGNLYVVSQGAQILRVFSPGGTTTATTGSDGTFELIRPPGLSVTTTDGLASEAGLGTGTFTVTRSGSTDLPLTVNYTLSGTASNGYDYATNSLSAVIPAGATGVDVVITPIDDDIPELAETVTINLVASSEYDPKPPVSASITLVDNEYPNLLTVAAATTNLSERFPNRTGSFVITRYGDTNLELFISYEYSGSATLDSDFAANPSGVVSMQPGEVTKTVTITPLDDSTYEGTETATFEITTGFEYEPGVPATASLQIADNDWPPGLEYFGDTFESDTSADWTVRFGANNNVYDATNIFAYDYVAAGIPLAPHSMPGSSKGLYLAVNKYDSTAGGSAGINVYPNGRTFSGDYLLRFDMYLSFGTAGTTEHALAGLNHSGLLANRVSQSTDTNGTIAGGDGVFVAIETDASNNRDYTAYTLGDSDEPPIIVASRLASAMTAFLPSPPYAFAGSPGNVSTSTTKTWSSVELSQVGNLITLKVNDGVVFIVTNQTGFTSGNIMLGHNDQFDSVGSIVNYVIFDNVQVLNFGLRITSVELLPGNQVQIDFVTPPGTGGQYHLQSTSDLATPFVDDDSAQITVISGGFRAVTTRSGAAQYYRIRQ